MGRPIKDLIPRDSRMTARVYSGHKSELTRLALDRGVTVNDLVVEAIALFLEKHGDYDKSSTEATV